MKITRRALLISGGIAGGGLLLGMVGLGGYVSTYDRREQQRSALPGKGKLLSHWITIDNDGNVTILSPHTEMGQGANTGLLQIVLDELDADPAKTTIQQAPAAPEFANSVVLDGFVLGESEMEGWTREFIGKAFGRGAQFGNLQITGGSASVRFTGWIGMRKAAATARQMLAQVGAVKLGVPFDAVHTQDGKVIATKTGKSVGYGELAEVAAGLELPENPPFKDPAKWKYIGKPFARVDLPDKIFAKAVYAIDVDVPNMRYAAVAPPPMALARVTGVENEAELKKRRGVEAVVVLDDVVAVVADNPWRAEQAVREAKVTYEANPDVPADSETAFKAKRDAIAAGSFKTIHETGDAASALSSGEVIEAEYVAPYLSHSTMEPLSATLWVEDGKTHVATGSQDPLSARAKVADVLGKDLEEVIMHAKTMGGGFGRRNTLSDDYANWLTHAAKIHQKVGGAVKMTWSREADTRLSTYRPGDVARMRAVLDDKGRPLAWHSQSYANIGAAPEATPHYKIPNITVETVAGDPTLPYAYWRSVDASTHGFFIESFIDELARKAKADPIEYRLSLMDDGSRHARLLKHVAKMSGWKERDKLKGSAQGVAIFKSFGSIVAQVAQVTRRDGKPHVEKVWCAVDCGVAINPNSVEAQMQGGIFYGLSAALYGQVTLKEGALVQSNFHNYPIVRFGDGPRIEVAILNSPEAKVGGAGEPGTPPIAPAVANALAALDERPRQMPFAPMV